MWTLGREQWLTPVSQHFGRPRRDDHLRSVVRDHPGQHGETLSTENSPGVVGEEGLAQWLTPIFPAFQEAEVGGLLGVRSLRTAWATRQDLVLQKNLKISQVWWHVPVVPAPWEAEVGGQLEPGRVHLLLINFQKLKIGRVQWLTTGILALWEAEAGGLPEDIGRLRLVDLLRSGVQDKTGQHGETSSLLKIQKLGGHVGSCSFILRWSLALLPRRKCRGTISAHCNLCLRGSRDPPASASQEAGTTEMGFHHVGQTGFELQTSSNPPTSASQKYSGVILGHCSLKLLGTSDPPASVSQVSGSTEIGSHFVAKASLKLLSSNDPPTSASRSVEITALWEAEVGGSPEVKSLRPAWPTWQNHISTKNTKLSWAWWHMPHFERLKQEDRLSPGVQDQPGQHGETLPILKIPKLARCRSTRLWSQLLGRLRQADCLSPLQSSRLQ
ncbi:hypothetical protein AAY473_013847 [Plecturocebus cupreus]